SATGRATAPNPTVPQNSARSSTVGRQRAASRKASKAIPALAGGSAKRTFAGPAPISARFSDSSNTPAPSPSPAASPPIPRPRPQRWRQRAEAGRTLARLEMTGHDYNQEALVQPEREPGRDVVGEPGDEPRREQLAGVDRVLSGQTQQPVATVEGRALELDSV